MMRSDFNQECKESSEAIINFQTSEEMQTTPRAVPSPLQSPVMSRSQAPEKFPNRCKSFSSLRHLFDKMSRHPHHQKSKESKSLYNTISEKTTTGVVRNGSNGDANNNGPRISLTTAHKLKNLIRNPNKSPLSKQDQPTEPSLSHLNHASRTAPRLSVLDLGKDFMVDVTHEADRKLDSGFYLDYAVKTPQNMTPSRVSIHFSSDGRGSFQSPLPVSMRDINFQERLITLTTQLQSFLATNQEERRVISSFFSDVPPELQSELNESTIPSSDTVKKPKIELNSDSISLRRKRFPKGFEGLPSEDSNSSISSLDINNINSTDEVDNNNESDSSLSSDGTLNTRLIPSYDSKSNEQTSTKSRPLFHHLPGYKGLMAEPMEITSSVLPDSPTIPISHHRERTLVSDPFRQSPLNQDNTLIDKSSASPRSKLDPSNYSPTSPITSPRHPPYDREATLIKDTHLAQYYNLPTPSPTSPPLNSNSTTKKSTPSHLLLKKPSLHKILPKLKIPTNLLSPPPPSPLTQV